jgi:hypothetical protein
MGMTKFAAGRLIRTVAAASLASAVSLSSAHAAARDDEAEAQARESWRESIVQAEMPGDGCFFASYPDTKWLPVECTAAPDHPFVPRHGRAAADTVGNGNDYAAEVSGLMSRSVGSFPTIKGVTSETGLAGANDYSLQLNSDFMTTAACESHSGCLAWAQFVYSSSEEVAFMQFWLINFGAPCPTGWHSYEGDCYRNSAAVTVPDVLVTALNTVKLAGKAVAGGKDILTFTVGTTAHSVTANDSVVDLASAWQASEFNVIGDGGGSEAVFNKGSSIRVRLEVINGTTTAPTCLADAGTTGETNNLNLRACTATGGTTPFIAFTESN